MLFIPDKPIKLPPRSTASLRIRADEATGTFTATVEIITEDGTLTDSYAVTGTMIQDEQDTKQWTQRWVRSP